jgi:hypothetical protein
LSGCCGLLDSSRCSDRQHRCDRTGQRSGQRRCGRTHSSQHSDRDRRW